MTWLLVLAMLISTAAVPPAGGYTWPLPEIRVTRRFDPPPEPWLPGHRGVDLAGRAGETVTAAASGRVAFSGTVAGRGVVSIAHPDGITTTYEPVIPTVRSGDAVERARAVGVLSPGHEGCPVAACLHWGAKRAEAYLDPLSLLGLGRIRLKPWQAAAAARPPAVAHPRRRRRPGRRSAAARRYR